MNFPWHSTVKILHQAEEILALSKPCGLLSHPNRENSVAKNALVLASYNFKEEAYEIGKGSRLYLLNRLDAPTSGLVLLTTSIEKAQAIRKAFKSHHVQKTYQAVVKGPVSVKIGTTVFAWNDRLSVQKNERHQLRVGRGPGSLAMTQVKILKNFRREGNVLSHIELSPKTGRTHQLRVQCALRKYPILGDRTYGDFRLNRALKVDRLFLHAHRMVFNLETHRFDLVDPIPEEIRHFIEVKPS